MDCLTHGPVFFPSLCNASTLQARLEKQMVEPAVHVQSKCRSQRGSWCGSSRIMGNSHCALAAEAAAHTAEGAVNELFNCSIAQFS